MRKQKVKRKGGGGLIIQSEKASFEYLPLCLMGTVGTLCVCAWDTHSSSAPEFLMRQTDTFTIPDRRLASINDRVEMKIIRAVGERWGRDELNVAGGRGGRIPWTAA